MIGRTGGILWCVIMFACAGGSATAGENTLTVNGGNSVYYRCGKGERVEARYYSLSDGSLHFVKVRMPDGREYTLPRVVSASGARYTDDMEVVWWTKGEFAFAEMRGRNGNWEIMYEGCGEIPEE